MRKRGSDTIRSSEGKQSHLCGSFDRINQTIGAEFVLNVGAMDLSGSPGTVEEIGYLPVALAIKNEL
jgi:hypothetical protein